MSDTPLFPDLGETPSPKLVWLKEHRLTTYHCPLGGFENEFGDWVPKWVCRLITDEPSNKYWTYGEGETELEATIDLAIKRGIPHYSIKKS